MTIDPIQLAPTQTALKSAMINALHGRVKTTSVDDFVKATAAATAPAPLSATASIIFAAIYGNVTCEPKDQPYKFNESIWGLGAQGGAAIGFMYTAYNSWDAFFKETTSFHVQGLADGGGILQISWFNKSATPIGQFNGALGGAGGLEGGGAGTWKHT